ncbi:MAG: EAL domain-containing protein [Deltaproteobacteria bacterium]|nr:EAL domain-containing protein [Deltaproteobacteria bacterium]
MKDDKKTKEQLQHELKALRLKVAELEATEAVRKLTEEKLRKSEASLANAQRIARLGNWDWDIVNNELAWSDEIYRIFGVEPREFAATYKAFLEYVHPDDRELVKKAVDVALSGGEDYSIDHRIVLPDGAIRIVHERAEVVFDASCEPVRMIGTAQDVTEHKKIEEELRKLSMAIEHSVNIVFITDKEGNIEYVNPMFEKVTGWDRVDVIGKTPRILGSGETTGAEYEELWKTIDAGKTWRGSFKNKRKDGRPYWGNGVITPINNEKGEITHFLAVQEDITERRISEERASYLASHDELTGLVNRIRFIELLNGWIYVRTHSPGVLLLLNIDDFKLINDVYGHGLGDELLRSMAGFLQSLLKESEAQYIKTSGEIIAGRMGGDEFAVFLPYFGEREGTDLAERIRGMVEASRPVDGDIHITVSAGVALYPGHSATASGLLAKAGAAVSRAKENGRNRCHLYCPGDMYLENIYSRLAEKAAIQKALSDDRFVPWFQPILCLKDNKAHHYEALARMRDEKGSILLPEVFIDTAERFGLIGAIDRVITEKTMICQAEMGRQKKHVSFGMNLSGKDLGDEDILLFLQSRIKFISELKAMGCRFSLDDFGVGFTSFVYLKKMQVDYIKIDGFFVRRLHENKDDQHIVKAITDVAKSMGIKTVAEFVENEETLRLLREYGVDYAQGYLIGKPGPELL